MAREHMVGQRLAVQAFGSRDNHSRVLLHLRLKLANLLCEILEFRPIPLESDGNLIRLQFLRRT